MSTPETQISVIFSERVRTRRNRLNLTQEQLSEQAGVSWRAITEWEKGKLPNANMLLKLARSLKCTVGWLLGEDSGAIPQGEPLAIRECCSAYGSADLSLALQEITSGMSMPELTDALARVARSADISDTLRQQLTVAMAKRVHELAGTDPKPSAPYRQRGGVKTVNSAADANDAPAAIIRAARTGR